MPSKTRHLYLIQALIAEEHNSAKLGHPKTSLMGSGDESAPPNERKGRKDYDDILNDLIVDHWADELGLKDSFSSDRIGMRELDVQLLIRNSL